MTKCLVIECFMVLNKFIILWMNSWCNWSFAKWFQGTLLICVVCRIVKFSVNYDFFIHSYTGTLASFVKGIMNLNLLHVEKCWEITKSESFCEYFQEISVTRHGNLDNYVYMSMIKEHCFELVVRSPVREEFLTSAWDRCQKSIAMNWGSYWFVAIIPV